MISRPPKRCDESRRSRFHEGAAGVTTQTPTRTATSNRSGRIVRRRKERQSVPVFLAPSVVGLSLFTLFPIIMTLVMSMFHWSILGERYFVGPDNYGYLLQDPTFRRVALNTAIFVGCYVPINVVISLGLAAWVSPKIRGRVIFRVLFFIPVVTPMVANAMVWRLLLEPGGPVEQAASGVAGDSPNFLGEPFWAMASIIAMSVWQGFGYNFLLFSAALDQVPREPVEAAMIDGASAWRTFMTVRLPLITPTVFFAVTMTIITAFQAFAQPFILTAGGPGISTQTMVMFMYQQGFQFMNLGVAAAGAWVLFVIIMAITAIQFLGQRTWVHYER